MKVSKHPLYNVWNGMLHRCYNPRRKAFKNYGERGIKVYREWRVSAEAFFRWAESNGYAPGLTLDRINNDGNYEPSNCRFASHVVQVRNRRCMSTNTSGYIGVSPLGCPVSDYLTAQLPL
jgi:hypothetical protein